MKVMMGPAIVLVLLATTQAYDLNNSFDYGAKHANISLSISNRSNLLPWDVTYNQGMPGKELMVNSSVVSMNTKGNVIDRSANLKDRWNIASKANIFLDRSNRSNSSPLSETVPMSVKGTYDKEKFSAAQMRNYSGFAGASEIKVTRRSINLNVNDYNGTYDIIHGAVQRINNSLVPSRLENYSPSIVVHPGESIQAAVDAAAPESNIEVQSGTYRENVYVNKSVVIRGADMGEGLPIVDASGNGNAIEISAEGVTLSNLIVTNSPRYGISKPGAGVMVTSNNCVIRGIVAYNNGYGINLFRSNGDTLLENNLSDNNCGIKLSYSNNNVLKRNYFKNNQGGLRLSSSINNTITANTVDGSDYGVNLVSSNGNLIFNNSLINESIGDIKVDDFSKLNKIINNTIILKGNRFKAPTNYLPPVSVTPDEPKESDATVSDGGGVGQELPTQEVRPTATEEIQKCIDEEVERLPWGKITFTPPEKMSNGVTYPVVVRISRDLFENMTNGLEKFEKVETERLRVSYEMNVKLDGGDYFKISPEAQEPKTMLKSGFAEWTWEVTPQEPGTHLLKLTAIALISLKNGEEKKVEAPVFEKEIEVYVDQVREIKLFFLGSGKWIVGLLVTTLVGGAIALFSNSILDAIKSLGKKKSK